MPTDTVGIDLGTSGVRAVVLHADGTRQSQSVAIRPEQRRDPAALWDAVGLVLSRLMLDTVGAIAVAGTSGTIVATDRGGAALGRLSLYNDAADAAIMAEISNAAPAGSPARGHTSPLGRAIGLARATGAGRILHEADWIAGRLCGRFGFSDENNALKTGYDPVTREWPDWVRKVGLDAGVLPRVFPPGQPIAPVAPDIAVRFGLPAGAVVATGTTDGCASFLSTGASQPGDAVTVLGSTLTLKLLSTTPVSAPEFGIYSHRLWDAWLTGGASNSGGGVLAQFFSPLQIANLSERIIAGDDSGLRYYPLLRPGERFPVNDPAQKPCLLPRPYDDALFLHGMLEGIARIEALGYRRLHACGAPLVRGVTTVGGGADNPAWSAIRRRILGATVVHVMGTSAAHGAALVACRALTGPAQCAATAIASFT